MKVGQSLQPPDPMEKKASLCTERRTTTRQTLGSISPCVQKPPSGLEIVAIVDRSEVIYVVKVQFGGRYRHVVSIRMWLLAQV